MIIIVIIIIIIIVIVVIIITFFLIEKLSANRIFFICPIQANDLTKKYQES